MILPARPAAHGQPMAMAGMTGHVAAANPALALVFALFMLGYVLWSTDQLAALSRSSAAAIADRAAERPAGMVSAGVASASPGAPGHPIRAAAALAPRFAA